MKPRWNTSPIISPWLSGYVARNNTCIAVEIMFPITKQNREKRNRTRQRDKEYLKQGIWMQLITKYFSSMCFAKITKTIEMLKIYWNSVPYFSTQYISGDINTPAWVCNHVSSKVWWNYSLATVDVWKWIINFIPHIIMDIISYPYQD